MEAYENESTKKGASDNFYKKEAWFFSLISYFLTYAILFLFRFLSIQSIIIKNFLQNFHFELIFSCNKINSNEKHQTLSIQQK
jgi:hypothetical protein